MANVVGGITRLFQPTVGVLVSDKGCRGLNPWYFLVGLHLVSVFFAYGPWDAVKSDLVCYWPSSTGDEKTFCDALCYNQRFPVAVSSAWALHLLTMLIVVALMKFVYVTVKKKDSSGNDVETAVEPTLELETSSGNESYDVVNKNEFGGWRYPVYVLCIVMMLATTSVFMFVLISYQLPAVMQKTFTCTPESADCPASVQCAFTGRSDKRAILWAMACCSAATISLCVGYLATHASQACGFCGDRDGTEKTRAGPQSGGAERVSRRAWREGGDSRRESSGDSRREGRGAAARRPDPRGDVGVGIEGCSCQLDGANCCCRNMTCDCYDNRYCPCYFPGSDTGLNSLACREESDGKLLRGDTEVVEERREWRAHEERRITRQPLRTGPQRSRAGPGAGGMRRV